MPTPIGGALIRYAAFNLTDGQFRCGVATIGGPTLDENDSQCPPDGAFGSTSWSPDGTKYVYFQQVQGQSEDELYLVSYDSPKVADINLGTFQEQKSNMGFFIPPHFAWLGNSKLLLSTYNWTTSQEDFRVLDINSRKDSSLGSYTLYLGHYTPAFSPSPDGEMLAVQSWTASEQSDFDLITVQSGKHVKVTEDIQSAYGIVFPSYFKPVWSPDGSRFVIAGQKDGRAVFIILRRDGNMLLILDAGAKIPFGMWASWNPDGTRLLIMCNPVSRGHYGEYDLCLADAKGEVENVFPYQRHWDPQGWAQWSSDGSFLYYLLKSGPYVYPAKLFRLDIRSGINEQVAAGLFDYGWIQSYKIDELYNFTGIKWSPDGRWMILNNSGPQEDRPGRGGTSIVTSALCDPTNRCDEFRLGSLIVVGAEWWQPPADWVPCHPPEEATRKDLAPLLSPEGQYNCSIFVVDNSSPDNYYGFDSQPLPLKHPFTVALQFTGEGSDFAAISLSGRVNTPGKEWWQGIRRMYIIANPRDGTIRIELRDGLSESGIAFVRLPGLRLNESFSIHFLDAHGESFMVVDQNGDTIAKVDVTALTDVSLPKGLFPDSRLYVGVLLKPLTKLEILQASMEELSP